MIYSFRQHSVCPFNSQQLNQEITLDLQPKCLSNVAKCDNFKPNYNRI